MTNHRNGGRVTGKDYRPACERCDVPPWEVCECSFDWAKEGFNAPPIPENLTAGELERIQYLLWKDAA